MQNAGFFFFGKKCEEFCAAKVPHIVLQKKKKKLDIYQKA